MKNTREKMRLASVAGVAVIGLTLAGCSSGSSASDDAKTGQDSRGPIT